MQDPDICPHTEWLDRLPAGYADAQPTDVVLVCPECFRRLQSEASPSYYGHVLSISEVTPRVEAAPDDE